LYNINDLTIVAPSGKSLGLGKFIVWAPDEVDPALPAWVVGIIVLRILTGQVEKLSWIKQLIMKIMISFIFVIIIYIYF